MESPCPPNQTGHDYASIGIDVAQLTWNPGSYPFEAGACHERGYDTESVMVSFPESYGKSQNGNFVRTGMTNHSENGSLVCASRESEAGGSGPH